MSTKTSAPPLSEFIDLSQRRDDSRAAHGFQPMKGSVTVAIYDTAAGYQTLTIRISDDLAIKHNLIEGARLGCHVHPDQQYIALLPGHGRGSALFRPKRSRSLVYQTTLKEGTLEPQSATAAKMSAVDGGVVISITPK